MSSDGPPPRSAIAGRSGRRRATAAVAQAAWLADDVVLVLWEGHGDANAAEIRSIALDLGGEPVVGHACGVSYPESDLSRGGGSLIVAALSTPEPTLRSRTTLTLKLGDEPVGPVELEVDMSDVQTLIRETLAPLDAPTRTRLVEFIGAATGSATTHGLQLSRSLGAIREALRERLPLGVNSVGHPQGLAVSAIVAPDDTSCYLKGWMRDEQAEIIRLTAVSPEGARAELRERLFHQSRPDLERFYSGSRADTAANSGFVCFFDLPAPSLLPRGWILEMENADGACIEVETPIVLRAVDAARDAILSDLAQDRGRSEELLEHHVFPALSRIQQRLQASVKVASVDQYGSPPDAPEISIVVSLYMRLDMIEQQLAEFAHDPDVAASDLIYVLDSPEQADTMRGLAAQLFPVYEVPFRVVVLERNVGFAGATNAGAALGRGRLLVLLNSDNFPDKPGWLTLMSTFYDATPGIGALGPKLLFEDDSIQHAGMYFQRSPEAPLWVDGHYFQGMHRSLPAANVARRVPAVSGACLMIARELFERVGGLSTSYVLGYYEDFDLCLKLSEAGLASWYLPTVELYHLEGQSYTDGMRRLCWRYNTWLQTRTWNDRIQALVAEHGVPQ